MRPHRRTVLAVTLALVGASAIAVGATGSVRAGAADSSAPSASSGQWLQPAGDYGSTRFSQLDQVTAGNAKDLQVSWMMSMGTTRGLEGQPLVVGDTMYAVSSYPNYVYAIDLHNNALKWKYVPPDQLAQSLETKPLAVRGACCDVVNRGAAYSDGKLFFLTLDGHVTALDATTGRVLWNVQNADPKLAQTGTAAPLVVHGKVLAGMSGDEYGVRGYMTAYDENTGRRLWRAFNTGPDADMLLSPEFIARFGANSSLKTWQGDQWKQGGGAPWAWMSYDPDLNLLFYTTGNPTPWNPDQRPGDNKWGESVMARNPDTGRAVWAYQFNIHDNWDYDSTQEMIFFDAPVAGGKTTPAMAHFDKNGYAYVLERRTGKLLAAHSYYANQNVVTGVDMKTGRTQYNPAKLTHEGKVVNDICPFAQGAKDLQPAAYNPQTKLFYIPTNNGCMQWQSFHTDFHPGQDYIGAIIRFYEGPGGYGGALEAFDPMTGKTSFLAKESWPVWSGVLTTAGGVTFYGTLDGFFKAVDAKSGKELYKFHMPSGVIGAPIAYTTPSGDQEIAVYSGVGGWPASYIGKGDTDPTGDLGAVNYYRYGRCDATGPPCKKPLQDVTNLGGELVVFHLPAGHDSSDGAALTGLSTTETGLLAAGAAAVLVAVFLLGLTAVRRRRRRHLGPA